MSDKDKYVFQTDPDGRVEFVGDFEGLYRNVADPWNQSGDDGHLRAFYQESRQRLIGVLERYSPDGSMLEIGCGHGHVTASIAKALPAASVDGSDISETAILRARELFPDGRFYCRDIRDPNFELPGTYDVVIFNQMLWYVLNDLPSAIGNAFKVISDNGYFIISLGFLPDQKYGRDVIDGVNGLLAYFARELSSQCQLVFFDYDDSDRFDLKDGLFVARKRSGT
jgi:SAM-dependent methyltransferase